MRFKVATHPIKKSIACLTFWCFNTVVDTDKPGPLFHERVKFLDMRIQKVSSATVTINNDCVGTL